jgi:hypothetical protein
MPALDAGIFFLWSIAEDGRIKSGHDENVGGCYASGKFSRM